MKEQLKRQSHEQLRDLYHRISGCPLSIGEDDMEHEGTPTAPQAGLPVPDALLEFDTSDPSHGFTCATLTPTIKSRLKELEGGQVLEVRVDDPSARLDVPAWSRMSGNE